MCGLIGVFPKNYISKAEESVFKQLLWADALRGWDSTGVFKGSFIEKVEILKTVGIPSNLFVLAEKQKFEFTGKFLVGHNRAATRGEKNVNNAHPFKEEHITLVHNGTLFGHNLYSKKVVDSHAICELLASDIKIQDLIDKIDGSYALIWHNDKNKTINFLRNNERPLFLFEAENTYFTASEKELGIWILTRNDIKIKAITELTPWTHYELNIKKHEIKETEYKKPEKTAPPFRHFHTAGTKSYTSPVQDYLKNYLTRQFGIRLYNEVEIIVDTERKARHGSYNEYWGVLKADETIEVNFYSPNLYAVGDTVIGKYTNILGDDMSDIYMFVTETRPKEHKDVKKKPLLEFSDFESLPVDMQNKYKAITNCSICGTEYMVHPANSWKAKEYNKHVYGYSYVCGSCITKGLH